MMSEPRTIDADEFVYNLTHWFDKHGFSHSLAQPAFTLEEIEDAIAKTLEETEGEDNGK